MITYSNTEEKENKKGKMAIFKNSFAMIKKAVREISYRKSRKQNIFLFWKAVQWNLSTPTLFSLLGNLSGSTGPIKFSYEIINDIYMTLTYHIPVKPFTIFAYHFRL